MHTLMAIHNACTQFLLSPIGDSFGLTFLWGDALGMLSGIGYVYLATRQRSLAWPVSLINILIYVLILPQEELPANGFLQVLYFFMSLYGWYHWRIPATSKNKSEKISPQNNFLHIKLHQLRKYLDSPIPTKFTQKKDSSLIHRNNIKKLSPTQVTTVLLITIAICSVCYTLFQLWNAHAYSSSSMIFADATLTGTSLVLTWLEIRKYLDCWAGWIIVDCGYILTYTHQQLYLSSFLSAIYVGFAIYGFSSWKKILLKQKTAHIYPLKA